MLSSKFFKDHIQRAKKILDQLPFAVKLHFNMIGLVVGMSLLFLFFILYQVRATAMDELRRKGRDLALDLAWECELGVLADDRRFLAKPVSNKLLLGEIVYVMVYDIKGKYLAGRNKPHLSLDSVFEGFDLLEQEDVLRKLGGIEVLEFSAQVVTMVIEGQQEMMLFGQEEKKSSLDGSLPMKPRLKKLKKARKRTIGYVRLGVSLTKVEEQINQLRGLGLTVTVLFVVIGVFTTYFLAKVLSRSIITLTEGVEAIKEGDLDYRIELQSHDEFFELAETFNEMTEALKKRLEEIGKKNEEMEHFTYTVSHDLKSPLISIQGFASLFMKKYGKNLDENGRFFLDRILGNVDRMGDLIHDLLELSRIGRINASYEKIDLSKIIDGIRESLLPQLEEKKIELLVPKDFPGLYMERTGITQVLNNLIINAVKFMGDNPSPKIEIAFRKVSGYYEIGIIDNGIGIEKEFQEKIFGLFQRLDLNTEGTGIGLAIVRKTVEVWGGSIRVDSEPGKGSAFYFTIPKSPPGESISRIKILSDERKAI